MDNQIQCPYCNKNFALSEVLKERIEKTISEKTQAGLDEKIAQTIAQAKREIQL